MEGKTGCLPLIPDNLQRVLATPQTLLLKPVSWGHARDAEIFLYRSNSIRIPLWGGILKKLSVIWKAFREFSFFLLLAPTAHCKPQCQRPESRRINGGFRNDVNNSKPGPNIRRTRFVSVKKISYVYPIALALGCGGICPTYHNTFRHGKTSAFGIDSVRPFGRIGCCY